MFEGRRLTNPRSLENRRSFDVVEYLAIAAGARVMTPEHDGRYDPASDGEATMACVDAADTALRLMVDTAAQSERKWIRRFYKRWTVDNGPAVVIMVATGLAAIDARMRPESATSQTNAQRRLADTFGSADTVMLAALVADVDSETGEGLLDATVDLAFAAAEAVVGNDAVSMPGFVGWYEGSDIERHTASLSWQICRNHAMTAWLGATDPDRVHAAD